MFVITDRIVLMIASIVLVIAITSILIRNREMKKRMKSILLVGLILSIVASVVCVQRLYTANKVIGTYEGYGFDRIVIDGVTYDVDYDNAYSSSDTSKLMGKVVYKKPTEAADRDPMYVWSIDGTDEYIFAVCVYDGVVYKVAE